MHISRRYFLRNCGIVTLGLLALRPLYSCRSRVECPGCEELYARSFEFYRWRELIRDPNGILDLPRNFSYRVISRTGETMSDGLLVPGGHDGMAAFPGYKGKTILVRNHELRPDDANAGPFGEKNELFGKVDRSKLYDAGMGETPGLGGTTTLVYDTRLARLEYHFLSLAGTHRNCAGGPTPWNSWITCEETVEKARGTLERDHGYNFEVPVSPSMGLVDPVPLKAMGRFYHEAVAIDQRSGVVYETEDREDGLLYRFVPDEPERLRAGGRLQALKIRDLDGADTRNWRIGNKISVGQSLEVEWVDIKGVESPGDDLRWQGFTKGAAQFAHGEGMWCGRNEVYFTCTNGGERKKGQIWRYVPSPIEAKPEEDKQPGRLELFVEPNDAGLLENADTLTVSPWGDLILCEDGKNEQFVVGVTPEGDFYKLARNRLNDKEFAGATFSPDGSTLFVNIQNPGLTLAITGPWPRQGGLDGLALHSQGE
ncbi:MAG: alkaline phosphatase PhoX [Candidatus Binatia bacterium]